MAKRCAKCGNFMMDDERFCPNCGENAQSEPVTPPATVPQQDNQQSQQQYYQQNNQQGQQYTYGQPGAAPQYIPPQQEEMSLGKWVWTIIAVSFFGLISLIICLVWAFGDGPESRRRFCKAFLIVELISIVLVILMFLVFGAMFAAIITTIINESGIDFSQIDINDIQYRLTAIASMFIR
ncbi:MAG: hypothetical protein ACI4J7_04170 [Ruminiclostridium sp.]